MAVMKNEIREFQPVGMRVLAVDDNPTCLRVLDALLRKCQYHVTTTNQATTALKLLRDKKNNFDLVISDVDMPDMDGFKLLELVGLEMDLPVIMLSAHGDTRLVMKGISYGACDYLLKPVRTEELKNIWQHVLRRHKCDPRPRARNTSDNVNGDSAEDLMGKGDSDHHNPGMKRKDQNSDEDENAKPNQDPSIKKQPRVVWSPELHRKFVAAVHQLGTNKVGPKKILELMNVEKLRKENVASHLQKYRLHLKRISCEAKETKLVASLRNSDSAHLPNGAPNGVRNSGCLCASRGFLQASYRSFSPDSAFSRLNNPTGNGSCGGITQSRHAHISIDTMNRTNQSINNSHGMPMPPSVDRPQYRRCSVQGHSDLSIINLDSGVNPTSSGFLDTKVDVGNAKSVFLTADSSVMLAGDFQDFQRKEFSGIQQSCVTAASNAEHSPNLCRSSDCWQNFVQSSLVLPEPSAIICSKESTSDDLIYKNSTLTTFGVTGSHCLTSAAPQICGTPITRTDFQCWTPVLMSNIGESSNSTSIQDRNELQQNECFLSNFTSGLVSSLDPPHGVLGSFNHRLEPTNSRGNGDYLYHLPRLQMSVDLTPTELHQVHLEEQRTDATEVLGL